MAFGKTKELETTAPVGALSVPSFIPKGVEGTEYINKDDLQVPRMGLCQALSPELDENNIARFIPEVKNGDMFSTLTKEVFGKGPLKFMVVRGDRPKGVEFIPREEGGGVKDFNVALDDPRMQFRVDAKGERKNPIATKFYDFVILLLPFDMQAPMANIIALSLKGSNLKTAKTLNSFIRFRGTPLYSGVYSLTSVQTKNPKGVFYSFQVANAGWPDSEGQMLAAKSIYVSIKDRALVVDRENLDPDAEGAEKA